MTVRKELKSSKRLLSSPHSSTVLCEKQLKTNSMPKLKALIRKIILFSASLIFGTAAIIFVGNYFADQITNYRRGNLRRLVSIIALEWVMAHLAVPMYAHLFSPFRTPISTKFMARNRNKRFRLYCNVLFIFIVLMAHLTNIFYLAESFEIPWLIYDISAICNGIWINLCIICLLFSLFNFVLKITSAFDLGRRIIQKVFSLNIMELLSTDSRLQVGLTIFLTLLLSISHWYYSDKFVIRHQKIHITRFTETKHILKAVILTDLHAGASVYGKQISKVVELVNELDADAIFLIGDIIDAPRSLIETRVESLRHLQSHLGTFYVTGNHEYYYGNVEDWLALFRSYGITVLNNNAVNLNGHCIVGLNDVYSDKSGIAEHFMDVRRIGLCSANQTTVVLAHNPSAVKKILKFSEDYFHPVDLILSGHTHCGQYLVIMPFGYLFLPYLYGLYSLAAGTTQLLVSAGTLFQNAPMKIPFMSEIWLIEII